MWHQSQTFRVIGVAGLSSMPCRFSLSCISEFVQINNWQDIGMPKNGTKLRARTFGANTTLPAFGHENIREST
uniref:Uncharacterized protein n=1 Tax=Oryza sativa subsp. japonica TaxID=39947 RepID=Q7XIC2_ORYSJ|nr:hypothetical protein [Oryza sativa Japonica Group]